MLTANDAPISKTMIFKIYSSFISWDTSVKVNVSLCTNPLPGGTVSKEKASSMLNSFILFTAFRIMAWFPSIFQCDQLDLLSLSLWLIITRSCICTFDVFPFTAIIVLSDAPIFPSLARWNLFRSAPEHWLD